VVKKKSLANRKGGEVQKLQGNVFRGTGKKNAYENWRSLRWKEKGVWPEEIHGAGKKAKNRMVVKKKEWFLRNERNRGNVKLRKKRSTIMGEREGGLAKIAL